jgi:hypothetical protein
MLVSRKVAALSASEASRSSLGQRWPRSKPVPL